MRRILAVIAIPLFLGGCLSFHSTEPPKNTTILMPPGSTAVCSNGMAPPC